MVISNFRFADGEEQRVVHGMYRRAGVLDSSHDPIQIPPQQPNRLLLRRGLALARTAGMAPRTLRQKNWLAHGRCSKTPKRVLA